MNCFPPMNKGIYQILDFDCLRNYFCTSASKSTCNWVGVFAFAILPECEENRTSRHCFAEVREECRHSEMSRPERPLMSECCPHICGAQSVWDTQKTSRTPEKQLIFLPGGPHSQHPQAPEGIFQSLRRALGF